jgi:hypothetical protein
MDGQQPPGPPDDDPDPNLRRRALIGLLLVALLVIGGLLLSRVLRNVGRLQDCVLSGRTNCAPIDTSKPGGS